MTNGGMGALGATSMPSVSSAGESHWVHSLSAVLALLRPRCSAAVSLFISASSLGTSCVSRSPGFQRSPTVTCMATRCVHGGGSSLMGFWAATYTRYRHMPPPTHASTTRDARRDARPPDPSGTAM